MTKDLSLLTAGQSGIVSAIGECDARATIMEMGILPNSTIKVINIAPLGGPVTIEVAGYLVSIRKSEAMQIHIMEDGLTTTI